MTRAAKIEIRVSAAQKAAIAERAAAAGLSVSELVRTAALDYEKEQANAQVAGAVVPLGTEPRARDPDRDAWIRRRVVQLQARGLTTPAAARRAAQERERR